MTSTRDLLAVRASDLMQTDVVTVRIDSAVEEVVKTLEEARISGAPVVDDGGNLLGVISTSDLVEEESARFSADRRPREGGEAPFAADEDEEFFTREDYDPEVLQRSTISDWMTTDIISVEPDADLREVCQLMSRRGIHRVLVVEGRTLAGIVTTSDVVRLLADRL